MEKLRKTIFDWPDAKPEGPVWTSGEPKHPNYRNTDPYSADSRQWNSRTYDPNRRDSKPTKGRIPPRNFDNPAGGVQGSNVVPQECAEIAGKRAGLTRGEMPALEYTVNSLAVGRCNSKQMNDGINKEIKNILSQRPKTRYPDPYDKLPGETTKQSNARYQKTWSFGDKHRP